MFLFPSNYLKNCAELRTLHGFPIRAIAARRAARLPTRYSSGIHAPMTLNGKRAAERTSCTAPGK